MKTRLFAVWLGVAAVPMMALAVFTLLAMVGVIGVAQPMLGYLKGLTMLIGVAAVIVLPRFGISSKQGASVKVGDRG